MTQQELETTLSHKAFLQSQGKTKIHPLNDTIEGINKVTQSFIKLFEKAPDHMKPTLATSPLFPEDVKFPGNSPGQRNSTCPLNYVMFAANEKALKMLCPYLKQEDWKKLGPFDSTFMHCIIAGIEKGSVQAGGNPIGCAKTLIEKFPSSKDKPNQFDQRPICYLQVVKEKLRENANFIETHGGGGWGGLGKMVTMSDGTNETSSGYLAALEVAKDLQKLLLAKDSSEEKSDS